MGNKGISIIIPVFNDGRFLHEAVESVYAQDTDLPFEIIIVDDGSTDQGTQKAIDNILGVHPEITVLKHERNKGVSAARNIGLSAAKYAYIFSLDADNKLSTDPSLISGGRGFMDRAVEILERDETVVFVRCNAGVFDAFKGQWKTHAYDERAHLIANTIDAHAVFRTQEALDVGGNNTKLRKCGDWDFAVAMLNQRLLRGQGRRVATIDDPVFLYRMRRDRSSISASVQQPLTEILGEITRRSPDIYQQYFPGKQGEELVGHLKRTRTFRMAALGFRLLLHPQAWPYLLKKVSQKLRITGRFNAASSSAPFVASPELVVGESTLD